jgi:hypothetical protein
MTRTHESGGASSEAPIRESARIVTLRVAAIALVAALGACGRDPVDSKLVGSWQTAIASPNGPYQLRFTTSSQGAYRIDGQGTSTATPETGSFKAAGGKWRRDKLGGGSLEGTYEFVSADSVLFRSKTETLLWNRVPGDAVANVTQSGAPAANQIASGGSQLSAELLAAGPFGAPLIAAAAVPQPSAPGAYGTAAPSISPPAPGGANGPPQIPSTASPGAEPGQTPISAQHAQQAAQAKASASEATAAVQSAKTAVQAEADEAAKRTGPFRKAGSKIKSFFTGHKSSSDDDAGSAPPH